MLERAAAVVPAILGAAVLAGCAGTPAALFHTGTASTSSPRAAHTAVVSAHGQRSATLAILSGAASVTVVAGPRSGQLVRASTPANSGIRPQFVTSGSRVQLFLASTGQSGPSAVTIELSAAVTWRLQFSGGASETVVNARRAQLASIDFTAGSSLIKLTLPRPDGTSLITLAGGASQVTLTVPSGVPARLRLYGGASTATLAGLTHTGLAGGTVLTPPGWATAASRYDVDAPAGVDQITVTS